MKPRSFSLRDSFHPTDTMKSFLHCITNAHVQARRRTSVFFDTMGKDNTPGSSSSSIFSFDDSDLCTLSGFETTPNYDEADTPLWRCRGEESTPVESPAAKAPKLLDSQVFVFWPEDFEFACGGEERNGRRVRRNNLPNQTKASRSVRRWSSPHTFGPQERSHPLPALSQVRSESGNPVQKKSTPTRLDVPPLKLKIKAHGVQSYCASNKWGNQPPAGYI
ncbi:hypothetical protein M422DRAFT_33683 [Sphaerobolus stellatus SS14]|uniref:Uncharacterized protein n=1 Tax=Sphaerobolus stellatus (strain SS14) TaxID=990650 RepID=A0A0C9VJ26_SPHS4|nr:hypothetical protein M422DRAFT_33683 [Sphaerobolus stellatus SS14]